MRRVGWTAGSAVSGVALLVVVALVVGSVGAVLVRSAAPASAGPTQAVDVVRADKSELPDVPPVETPDPAPSSGPLSPATTPSSANAAPGPIDEALAEAAATGERVEIPELRTESTTTYANPSGSLTESIAAGPVRVETADGWAPVDSTLVADGSGVRPRAVPDEVVLSPGGDAPLVSVTDPAEEAGESDATRATGEDLSVTVDVDAQLPSPTLAGSTATYADVFSGADLAVRASAVGTEVSVVIPEQGAGQESYELPLQLEGVTAELDDVGGLVLRDGDGEQVGYVSAPVMFDSTPSPVPTVPARPGDVTAELVERDGGQVLVLTPDPAYLADPATVYPVTIDPTASLSMVRDTYVTQAQPTTPNDSANRLYAGTTALTGPVRSFLNFNTAPIEGKNILSGTLRVNQVWSGAGGCTASPLNVQGATSLASGATWNTQPTLDGTTWGTANTAGDETACPSQVGQKSITITGLVQQWASNPATTGTLALLASETNASHAKGFYSNETGIGTPLLDVDYLTTPDQPTELSPGAGATVDTLRPVLSGKLTGGDGQNLRARFSLKDASNTEIGTFSVLVAPGSRASWTVPGNILELGQDYTWTLRSCAGTAPNEFCSSAASGSFTANPGLGAGDRPFFTYTAMGVTDRSSLRVNVASGSLVLEATDLSIAGTGQPLMIERTYNSVAGGNRMLGHRWTQNYTNTVRLEPHSDGSFTFYGESGEVSLITPGSGGSYNVSGDLDASFTDAGGFGVYVLTFNHDRGRRSAGESLYFYNSGSKKGMLWGSRDRNGHSNTLTYNGSDQITQVVDTQSRPVDYTLSGGHLTLLEDPNGAREVAYFYDANNDLEQVTDANGNDTLYDYDANHNLTKITDPEGGEIRIGYDSQHRVTSLTRERGATDETTTFAYTDNPVGQQDVTVVTDANNHETRYFSDNANRVERVRNALNQNEDKSYDVNSNVTGITQPGNLVYTFGYDTNNRNNLSSAEIPTGATESLTYNTSATTGLSPYLPTNYDDAQGNQTDYTHDAAGNRLTTVNDLATQNTASATYHGVNGASCGAQQGQVCTATDARGNQTSFGYDSHGNLTSVNNPAPLGDVTITYDAVSRIDTVTDGRGQDRSFDYDDLDRVTSITYDDSFVMSYTYDGNGNVTTRTDRAGAWTMDYDPNNRLTQSSGPGLDDVTFAYDPVGNVASLTDPGGTTEYEYTAINMVEVVRDPDDAETTFTYHPDHGTWRTLATYPNDVTIEYQHDNSGRVTLARTRDPANAVLTQFAHSFTDGTQDTALRQNETTPDGVYDYTYDALNRLTRADYTDNAGGLAALPNFFYAYDGAGNRTQRSSGTSTFYSYNNADQLTTGGATHDGNGNLTGSTSYGLAAASYNATDQTTSVTPAGGTASSQTYAGATQSHWRTSGARAFTTAGSMGITYIDDPSGDTSFIREPSGALVEMRRGGHTYKYLYDARGSVAGMTDETGNLVNRYRYEPYGAHLTTGTSETVANPFQFNAGYTLNGNLYKYGARFYDASLGRWTQVDPVPNQPRYAYANNDPINRADTTGLFSWSDFAGDVADVASIGSAVASIGCLGGVGCVAAGVLSGVSAVASLAETIGECSGGDECDDAVAGLVLSGASYGASAAGQPAISALASAMGTLV